MGTGFPDPGAGRGSLDRVEVWLCRTPDRAGPAVQALRDAGAAVRLLPLIGFRPLPDAAPLDAAVRRLAAGAYDWLVLTSVTTILALERTEPVRREGLAGLTRGVRVAAVGEGTRAALEARGVRTDLMPSPQSAAGLLAAWSDTAARILLPQSAIARPALCEGLAARGCAVDQVSAYETVDWPAGPDALQEEAAGPAVPLAAPEELAAQAPVPGIRRAVVLTSPSTARRFLARCVPLPADLLAAAIGLSTAEELAALGRPADAVAAAPTPEGIVQALAAAMSSEDPGPEAPGDPRFPDTGRQNRTP